MVHSHEPAAAADTRGHMLHWGRYYDLVVAVLTFGHDRAMRAMTADLADIRPGESILDVGCGTGSLTLEAARRAGPGGSVYGVDASPDMLARAQAKAAGARLPVNFQNGLVQKLPFPDATFDLILSSLMLHHVPVDLRAQAFAEMRRVLKPGGRLLAVDFRAPHGGLQRHLLGHLLHGRMTENNLAGLTPLARDAGFADVESGPTRMDMLTYLRARKP